MKDALKGLLSSKKFIAVLLSMVVWGVSRFGFEISEAQIAPLVVPIWLYILGQAFADGGKEAEKVRAGNGIRWADTQAKNDGDTG